MRIEENGIVYKIHNKTASVEGLSEYLKNIDVIIPDTINGYIVDTIEDNAFFGLDVKSITLPHSLKVIKPKAFAFCEKLEYVLHGTIKSQFCREVLDIQESAFVGCRNLKKINMAKYLNLYEYCFSDCCSLSSLDAVHIAIGEVFKNCNKLTCVTFLENCNLSQFIDVKSNIKKYNFLGDANISNELLTSIKQQNIKIECYVNSNVCDLAYNGISVHTLDLLF